MPDGAFNLTATPINTLHDLMTECQAKLPQILDVLEQCLSDSNPAIRLQACRMMLDRGFGKPRKHHVIHRTVSEH